MQSGARIGRIVAIVRLARTGRRDRLRILFDMAHPAHVHQFRVLAHALLDRGHVVRW